MVIHHLTGRGQNVPDLSLTIKDVAADGDVVFTHVTSEGTLSGGVDLSTAGNVISWDSIMMWRFEEGKIVDLVIARNHEHVDAQEAGEADAEKRMEDTLTAHVEVPDVYHNTSAHVAKVIEFQMAWERNKLETISGHIHEDYGHTQYPDSGFAFSDAVQGCNDQLERIENYSHTIRDIAADCNVVFTYWVEEGTVKSTGEPYYLEGMTLFKFKDGKILESITYSI
jgi:predicted SnoaL-like aldol condensation-catalyzing enzyme